MLEIPGQGRSRGARLRLIRGAGLMSPFAPDGRLRLDWLSFVAGIEDPLALVAGAGEGAAGLPDALPELKALVYWAIFDGEVSNGGVAQFYINQAPHLPEFEATARIIAAHPLLAEAAGFAEEALAAFPGHAAAVAEARESGEWPEAYFNELAPDFEDLQDRIWAVNKQINARLDLEILSDPHRYLDLSASEGWAPDFTGRLEAAQSGHNWSREGSLEFIEGFPLGPNRLDETYRQTRRQREIRLSPDRTHIEIDETPAADGRLKRSWRNLRLQRVERRIFDAAGRLQKIECETFDRKRSGEQAEFFEDGTVKQTELYDDAGVRLKSAAFFPGGQLSLATEATEQGEKSLRYWPSGQLNAEYYRAYPDERYINAYLEDGTQTLENGEGELTFFRREEAGVTYVFTCPVEKQRLHGTHIELKNGEESARKTYVRGEVVKRG